MHVSKLDAARRQLESAIRLFFLNGDPVAIHTLTGAARGLLGDLSRAEGKKGLLDTYFFPFVRPEKLGELKKLIAEAQNFFKHADLDPDAVLDFNPGTTEYLLWDCCTLYEVLTGHKLPILAVFNIWFGLANPHILMPKVQEEIARIGRPFDPGDRRTFFLEMRPVAEEWCAGATPGG